MPYTPDSYSNFGVSSVAGGAAGLGTPLQPTDTTLYVPSADVAKLPASSTAQFRVQIGVTDFARVTSRSSNVLTIVRANNLPSSDPDYNANTPPIAAVGTTVQEAVTAGSIYSLWTAINNGRMFIVTDYGALGNGSHDDTSAIQSAINACQNAGGGTVYFPAGTYKISSTLTISSDNVQLVGAGWGSVLSAAATFSATPMAQVQAPGGGNFRYGIRIADLFLNGNNVAGVGGVDLETTYYALLDHVRVRFCPGAGVNLGGSSGNIGAYNALRHCKITDGGAGTGVNMSFSEDNSLIDCAIFWYNTTGGVGVQLATGVNQLLGCRFDECQQAVVLASVSDCQIIGCQFTRGYVRHIYLNNSSRNTISGCEFDNFVGGGSPPMIRVDGTSNGGNLITDNTVNPGSGAGQFVQENGTMGGTPNLYLNNETAGLPISLVTPANGGGIARGNRGYNPLAPLPAPAAPGTTTATTGGTVAAGTYGVEVSYVNAFGETLPSANGPITTTGSTSTITIPSPVPVGNATGWYAYVTQVGGVTFTRQQASGSPTPLGTSLVLTAPPTNTGSNPQGSNSTAGFTQPAVPASTVALVNPTGSDCTVYVAGGTVTAIAVGGITIGVTSGPVRVAAGESVTLTYSAAPTWVWVGE